MYGDPLIFLGGLIEIGELKEGLISFMERKNELEVWDMWLHKVFDDISFQEFREKLINQARIEKGMSKQERELQVAKSQDILNNFKPPE